MKGTAALGSMEGYEAALKEIEPYFDNVLIMGTEAAARFDLLSGSYQRV
jgi:hypothetical protein